MYKDLLKSKKAVIFDLDGTIIDSTPLWNQALANVLSANTSYGWAEIKTPTGMFIKDKWHYVIEAYNIETKLTVDELAKQTYEQYLKLVREHDLQPREGFWNLLAELKVDKGLKVAMTTNSVRAITDPVMKHLGIENAFDVVLAGDEVKKPKPDPEIYLKCAKMLNIKPKECLVFEDSIVGVQSAIKAGMSVAVIWDGEVSEKEYPKQVLGFITDFTPLPGNLDETFKERFMRYVEFIAERRRQGFKPEVDVEALKNQDGQESQVTEEVTSSQPTQ